MPFYNRKLRKFEFYPRAFLNEKRYHGSEPNVKPVRDKYFKLAFTNFFILLVLFLLLFAYLFGSLYQLDNRIHALNIAFVDYDGGVIGTAFQDAYNNLKGPGFPTLQVQTPEQYADEQALRHAVCKIQYWGAIFIHADSSSNFNNALAGGQAAVNYNKSNAVSYIWNEARFGTVVDGAIAENIIILSDAAKALLLPLYAASIPNFNIDLTDSNVLSVISDPWHLQSINIKPTNQGSRLIYNTLLIVLVLISDFFFLGTMNGLYVQFGMFARFYPHRIILYRTIISLAYTFLGSLCTTSMIYAFRAGWQFSGVEFVEIWLVMWLFAHGNFLTLDVFSVWLPPPYVPMSLIAWVVINVTSVLLPFELSSPFYRWAYMVPAHNVFQTLIDIWSHGCNPTLRYSLTLLFAIEISSFILSSLGVYRRAHYAVLAEEMKEKEFQQRIDTAMAVERKREERTRAESTIPESAVTDRDESEERKELEIAEREERSKEEKEEKEEDVDGQSPTSRCDPISFPIIQT